jgi:hypothetical protein
VVVAAVEAACHSTVNVELERAIGPVQRPVLLDLVKLFRNTIHSVSLVTHPLLLPVALVPPPLLALLELLPQDLRKRFMGSAAEKVSTVPLPARLAQSAT